MRVLNPQRWNKYAYVANNPLAFTDPDGKDAAAVGFRTLAAGAGHAAALAISKDRRTTFGSFGPLHGGWPVNPGDYQVVDANTKVAFDSDNSPTVTSLAELAAEMAGIERVNPSSVDIASYKTSESETESLRQYLLSKSGQGWSRLYVVGLHDCIQECNNALAVGGIRMAQVFAAFTNNVFNIPRMLVSDYLSGADVTWSGEKAIRQKKPKKKDYEVESVFKPCATGEGCQ